MFRVIKIFVLISYCSLSASLAYSGDSKTITVIAPNGGEHIAGKGMYELKWSSPNDINEVYLDYSVDGGMDWQAIEAAPVKNDGSYLWDPVADRISENCFIRVTAANDTSIYDISDSSFSIYRCRKDLDIDYNRDCRVDFQDFTVLASKWLECGNPYDSNCGVCQPGWADCDFDGSCESYLNHRNTCGGCGNNCLDISHVSDASCDYGKCVVVSCESGYSDCDGQVDNGCETNLANSTGDCGECGYDCDDLLWPRVSQTRCSEGVCEIKTCEDGWANCDGDKSNGCEIDLSDDTSCDSAVNLGEICGDQGCTSGPSSSGRMSAWYSIEVQECDKYSIELFTVYFTAELAVPSGADYDLYLYDACPGSGGQILDSSVNKLGLDEHVHYAWPDNETKNDDKMLYLEIDYHGGSGCPEWSLQTSGGCLR